jgi:hypothetical protein
MEADQNMCWKAHIDSVGTDGLYSKERIKKGKYNPQALGHGVWGCQHNGIPSSVYPRKLVPGYPRGGTGTANDVDQVSRNEKSYLGKGVDVVVVASYHNEKILSRSAYIFILCSFLILILTPWSEKEREMNVESSIPGKSFAL